MSGEVNAVESLHSTERSVNSCSHLLEVKGYQDCGEICGEREVRADRRLSLVQGDRSERRGIATAPRVLAAIEDGEDFLTRHRRSFELRVTEALGIIVELASVEAGIPR
jgi:hypothetical protein